MGIGCRQGKIKQEYDLKMKKIWRGTTAGRSELSKKQVCRCLALEEKWKVP